MRDVPDIIKILREEERRGLLKNKIDLIKIYNYDEIFDNLLLNQWRFL